MKKLLLPLLCLFLVSPLVGCSRNNQGDQSSEGSQQSEPDPRANSLLPKDANNPHKIEFEGLSDYQDVKDTYNFDAVINASLKTSEMQIHSYRKSSLKGDAYSNEYYRFFNDEFITGSYDLWESGDEAPRVLNDVWVAGNVGGYFYTKSYNAERDARSYSVESTRETGMNAQSFVSDYCYTLNDAGSYLITDDYVYLVFSEKSSKRYETYEEIDFQLTDYTYFYIELTKDLRLSATYTYDRYVSNRVLPSGEESPEGFIYSETAALVLADYAELTDYSKKQEFYDGVPEGMSNAATIRFNYQYVTLTDGEITKLGSESSSERFCPYDRINSTQNQVHVENYKINGYSSEYVAIKSIQVDVYMHILKSDDPSKIGTEIYYTKTFDNVDEYPAMTSDYQIKSYNDQNYFVMPINSLINLAASYDVFSLTPNVSLSVYQSL